jgi:EmrB/QacA subfamily drug resistance transporter
MTAAQATKKSSKKKKRKPRSAAQVKETWLILATAFGSSMAFIDMTALNVVVPAMQKAFSAEASDVFWVLNSYLIPLTGLILVGGALGDLYGRKKLFAFGVVLFCIASLLCGLAPSIEGLVAARAFQGIGGAFLIPGALSLLNALVHPSRRGRAIGAWSAFGVLMTAGGPALGGYLSEIGLWRGIFFINIPVGALVLLMLVAKVDESREKTRKIRVDLLGALLITVSLSLISYGMLAAPEIGFADKKVFGSLILGTLSGIGFLYWESIYKYPMVPLKLFKSRVFSGLNLQTLLVYGAMAGTMFLVPLNLEVIQNYPPRIIGLTFLPMVVCLALLARPTGAFADRFGSRTPLTLGPILTGAGMLWIGLAGQTAGVSEYWSTYFVGALLMGLGMGIIVTPLTSEVMGAVPSKQSGVASGVNNAVSRGANAFAIATMGATIVYLFRQEFSQSLDDLYLPPALRQVIEDSSYQLAYTQAPEGSARPLKLAVETRVKAAFVDSFLWVSVINSVAMVFAAAIGFFSIPPRSRKRS